MKKLLLALFLMVASVQAATSYRIEVDFSGVPSDGDTVTLDGTVRTFKSSVTSPSTQVLIGATAADTAQNLYDQLVDNPISSVSPNYSSAKVTLIAHVTDDVLTASDTGANITTTVTGEPITQFMLMLPLVNEDASTRGTMADYVVAAFGYAAASVPASSTAFANFVDISQDQYGITGLKEFTGLTVISNELATFTLGLLSNVTARVIQLKTIESSTNQGIWFWDLDEEGTFVIAPGDSGFPSIYQIDSGALVSYNGAPGDDAILTKLTGNTLYARLGSANALTAANTFSGAVTISGALTIPYNASMSLVLTNADIGATNITVTNLHVKASITMTNTEPAISLYETDAGADESLWKVYSEDGTLTLGTFEDDGDAGSTVLTITRTGTAPDLLQFYTAVTVDGAFQGGTSISAAGILAAGDATPTVPTSMTKGLIFSDGIGATADPTDGLATWTASGEWKYRTDAASEGAGQENRVHNRAAQSIGSGSDYNLTTSYASPTFGGSVSLALPSAGTYLVSATVTVDAGATANDPYFVKLYNSTDAADVSGSEKNITSLGISERGQIVICNHVVTVTAAKTLLIHVKNNTAARGSIDSEQTTMTYVRLH